MTTKTLLTFCAATVLVIVMASAASAASTAALGDSQSATVAIVRGPSATPTKPACLPRPLGMVSWWPGDGNARDIIGKNNGTFFDGNRPINGIYAAGKVGLAFSLDGVDDDVDAGNGTTLHVSSGDFTVDAWVFFKALSHPPGANTPGTPPGDMSIIDKMISSPATNRDGWRLLKQDDNHFWFCFGNSSSGNGCVPNLPTTVRGSTVVTTSTWYHVAAVKSCSFCGNARAPFLFLYVNGKLDGMTAPLGPFTDTNSTHFLIGANMGTGAHLNGLIDEVELFNRALSPGEIAAIYKAGSAGKCKPPTPTRTPIRKIPTPKSTRTATPTATKKPTPIPTH